MDRREERRLVACLFVDVVGSTQHTMRLGPERLKAALGAAFNQLRLLIENEGGTVEKYIGDEIYALFGAPVAHEDDPARAIRAADAARRWAAGGQHATDVAFDIRIGVETGPAVIDLTATEGSRQQMSVGAVVNVASRLCHQAEPGQVLVGPVAHGATEELADFRALGPVDLKGVGPTEVWSLGEVRDEVPRRRLPFVGRQSELELLHVAFRRSATRSVLALVSGPPGQGKTRLVEEFITSLGPIKLLKARSRPGGEIGALAPLRDLLLGERADADLDVVVAEAISDPTERLRIRDALAHSAGIAASDALVSLGKDERDDEIQNAWRRFIRGFESRGPLVLWVEDVHWAVPDVVNVLDRIALSGERLLVILTARPEFAEAASLRPSGDRFFLELEGLDADTARVLAESVGSSSGEVVTRAQGNPLFIVELARGLGAGGDLPLTLQGALGARLDELDQDDRALLANAAVVGETFTVADAATLARLGLSMVSRALLRLVDLHYLDSLDGRYRFHHSLVRDVSYGRLLVADRMRLHARYARELASKDDLEVLAHHWWAALGGPDAEWVWRATPEVAAMRGEAFNAHVQAGARQAELFALDRAVQLLQRAYALASGERDRGVAKLAQAEAYANDLRGDDSWRTFREAQAHFKAAGKVPPQLYLGALKVRMRVGAFHTLPSAAEVEELVTEAEDAARASADPAILARTLVYSAFKDMDPATIKGDSARIAEAVSFSEDSDPATRREILGWHAQDLLRSDDLAGALGVLDRIDSLPGDVNELDRMEHLRARAFLALRAGDLPRLEDVALRIVAMSRRMGPHLRTHADAYAAQTALARADWPAVVALGEDTARLVRESPGTAFCSNAGIVLAYGAAAQGKAGRANEARAFAQQIPTMTIDDVSRRDLIAFALVFAGIPAEGDIEPTYWGGVTAVVSRSHDRALTIAGKFDSRPGRGGRFFSALADAIREEVAHDRGGPEPTHHGLREIGYIGWSQLLSARV